MSYVRTPAGTAAVLNPKVVMPRPVKALLLAINGQFDPYLYTSRLADAGDVTAMLAELLRIGYVQDLPGAPRQTVGFVAPKAAAPIAAPIAPPLESPISSPGEKPNSRALQDAVADMTDFVMQHLPADALEISFALEALSSTAQLEASLGAYEAKIRHLGAPANTHLAQVKQLLRQP